MYPEPRSLMNSLYRIHATLLDVAVSFLASFASIKEMYVVEKIEIKSGIRPKAWIYNTFFSYLRIIVFS